jgi:hypothetical protein
MSRMLATSRSRPPISTDTRLVAAPHRPVADVLRAVTRAGPRSTLAALLGVVLFVVVIVGHRRHVMAKLASVVAGTTVMITCAALLGLKVNFLDFVALPITLGISVDYAVNAPALLALMAPSKLDASAANQRNRWARES